MWRRERVVVADIRHHPLWRNYLAVVAAYDLQACWSTPVFSAAVKCWLVRRLPSQALFTARRALEIIDVAVGLAAVRWNASCSITHDRQPHSI